MGNVEPLRDTDVFLSTQEHSANKIVGILLHRESMEDIPKYNGGIEGGPG